MVVRAALLVAAIGLVPGPANAAEAVKVEFTGRITIGCLGCWDGATISGPATVAGTGGVYATVFEARLDEWTTPDLCTSFAQGSGTFSAGAISGRIDWFRSHNAIAIQVSGGGGSAVVVGDPVAVTLASCGVGERTFPVAGELAIAG